MQHPPRRRRLPRRHRCACARPGAKPAARFPRRPHHPYLKEHVMFRSILGFALFAIVALVAIKLVFLLLGVAFGLAITLLIWGAFGFLLYLVLRLVSTAQQSRGINNSWWPVRWMPRPPASVGRSSTFTRGR